MTPWIQLSGQGPLYERVYRALKEQILSGAIPEGGRLPPTRSLAEQLGISRNVVMIAYDQLKAEGFAEGYGRGGTRAIVPLNSSVEDARTEPLLSSTQGTDLGLSEMANVAVEHWRIRQEQHSTVRNDLEFDFRYGDVDVDLATLKIWKRLTSQYLNRPEIDYGDTQGNPRLREAIARYSRQARGCHCDADQVFIVNGSQQALDLIARLFIKPGTPVVMEDPVYQGAKSVFQVAGAVVNYCNVDEQGLRLEEGGDSFQNAPLIYVTPSHQFPTGAVLSQPRRMALLDWARQHSAYIVEDDYDSEFRYEGQPIKSLQGMDSEGRVIYVGTLSKVLFPSLRIGYMILPKALVEPTLALRWLADRHTVTEQQAVLAEFIETGHFERHLRRMRRRYAKRRQGLLDALKLHFSDKALIQGTNAGLHLLVWFNHLKWDQFPAIRDAAAQAGVGIYSVNQLYRHEPDMVGLLMGYASTNEQQITTGIGKLAEVLNRF